MKRIIVAFVVAVLGSMLVGAASPRSAAAAPGDGFAAIAPLRVLDTRASRLRVEALTSIPLALAPPEGASGVSVNLTVVAPTGAGWATIHPCGQVAGSTSNVNFDAGVTLANAVPFTALAGGVCVTSLVAADLVVDVTGWWVPAADPMVALAPRRVLDTRVAGGALGARRPRVVALPRSATAGVTLVVTEPAGVGWAAVHPCSQTPGTTSTLNFVAGQTVTNLALIPADADVCVTTSVGAHVVVDLVARSDPSGAALNAVVPRRLLDTRDQMAWVAGDVRLEFGAARSVALNVTAAHPLGAGFVTVWPCSQTVPVVSQMSWTTPTTVATAVLASPDSSGALCLRPSVGTHIVVDLLAADASVAGVVAAVSRRSNELVLGASVLGRPIVARAYGNPDGVAVLGVGVIHGDEQSGIPIVERLKSAVVPGTVAMWLIDSVNPDGQALQTRQNARGVDLNRNYPTNWQPIARSNNYSGTAPASEPETRAMLGFLDLVHPHLGVWWHTVGDYADDSRSGMDQPELLEIYVRQASIGIDDAPCLGFCGGTATQHANRVLPNGSHFVVELPEPITAPAASRHAAAFLAAASVTH